MILEKVKIFCKRKDIPKMVKFLKRNGYAQTNGDNRTERYDFLLRHYETDNDDFVICIHPNKITDWWHQSDESDEYYIRFRDDYKYINAENVISIKKKLERILNGI
jgi:hypothetical protein